MKVLLTGFLVFISIAGFGQCSDCKSISEAVKSPLQVKSLRVNPFVDKITLDSVPASVAEMKNLEILFLTDQNIRNIPAFIGNLTNLEELSFAGCKLEVLPVEIFSLPHLKELILFDNSFSDDYKLYIRKMCKEKMAGTKLLMD